MKRILFTTALVSAFLFSSAQDGNGTMMSKKGTPILPEAGNWSIGWDAVPVLQYFGNSFNGNTGNTVSAVWQVPMVIVGKYFTDANSAYRGMVRLGFGSSTIKNIVTQDGSTSTPPATVEDEWKESGNDITLGFGIQKYRGSHRVRGYYGAELMINLSSDKHTYSYGNAFSTTNTAPTTTDWTTPLTNGGYASGPQGSRATEEKAGSTFGFGVRGFIGVEYFFAPKLSLGAEYGWGIGMSSTGDGENTGEYWNGTGVATATSKVGGASSFGLDTDNMGGAIVLSAYF
ncbi:MAG: hypothetical protein IT242_07490 [Bacteroidia bacterium]|nr:hypothetical protein [Bacteroidia bacterium]